MLDLSNPTLTGGMERSTYTDSPLLHSAFILLRQIGRWFHSDASLVLASGRWKRETSGRVFARFNGLDVVLVVVLSLTGDTYHREISGVCSVREQVLVAIFLWRWN